MKYTELPKNKQFSKLLNTAMFKKKLGIEGVYDFSIRKFDIKIDTYKDWNLIQIGKKGICFVEDDIDHYIKSNGIMNS